MGPRPAAGFKLLRQKISGVDEQQRRDGEALRRLEKNLQGRRGYERIVPSGDVGVGSDARVAERLSALEGKVFGQRLASMEALGAATANLPEHVSDPVSSKFALMPVTSPA